MLNDIPYGNLLELGIELCAFSIISCLLGFFIARSFYQTDKALKSAVVQQEIMRLRRRLADADTAIAKSRKTTDRLRRRSKLSTDLDI